MQYYACSTLSSLAFFPLWLKPLPWTNHSQPPHPVDLLSPMHELRGGTGTRYYLWNGSGIELAQGGLSMWACVNLLAGCECIIFHNQPAVWCTRGKWGCCGSADGAAPRWWKCIRWAFFFFFFLFVVRLKEREGKRKEGLVWLDLCVGAREWNLIKVG